MVLAARGADCHEDDLPLSSPLSVQQTVNEKSNNSRHSCSKEHTLVVSSVHGDVRRLLIGES